MSPTAHRHYQTSATATASPQQLVLMLYDGALERIERARTALLDGRPGAAHIAHEALVRSQAIVDELRVSLDLDAGGKIAANLASIYVWCGEQLVEANLRKDAAMLVDVERVVRDLRDTWKHACVDQPVGVGT